MINPLTHLPPIPRRRTQWTSPALPTPLVFRIRYYPQRTPPGRPQHGSGSAPRRPQRPCLWFHQPGSVRMRPNDANFRTAGKSCRRTWKSQRCVGRPRKSHDKSSSWIPHAKVPPRSPRARRKCRAAAGFSPLNPLLDFISGIVCFKRSTANFHRCGLTPHPLARLMGLAVVQIVNRGTFYYLHFINTYGCVRLHA